MQLFLNEIAARHPDDRIVMVIDGAGWHRSQSLTPPQNIHLLSLPPYAPELNPIEHVWDELREKFFHNRVFKSLDALEDHLALSVRSRILMAFCVVAVKMRDGNWVTPRKEQYFPIQV